MAKKMTEKVRFYKDKTVDDLIKTLYSQKLLRYLISVNETATDDNVIKEAIFVGSEKNSDKPIILQEILDFNMTADEIENHFLLKYRKKVFDKKF